MSENERRVPRSSGVYEVGSQADDAVRGKIAALQERRDAKAKELQELRVFHAEAWKQYGSELCPNGMLREEREVEAELQSLKDDIALLETHARGEPIVSAAAAAAERLIAVGEARRTLECVEADATVAALRAERLRQLLG